MAQTPEGTRLRVSSVVPTDVLVESPSMAKGDLQIICLFESKPENELMASLAEMDSKLEGSLRSLRQDGLFRGDFGETLLLTPRPGAIGAKRLLLIGLGNRAEFKPEMEERIGEIVYIESERLRVAAPTFAPTILDGGKTGINTGETAKYFLRGFTRGREICYKLATSGYGPKLSVKRLTYLAGTAHAEDTRRGLEEALGPFEAVPMTTVP